MIASCRVDQLQPGQHVMGRDAGDVDHVGPDPAGGRGLRVRFTDGHAINYPRPDTTFVVVKVDSSPGEDDPS